MGNYARLIVCVAVFIVTSLISVVAYEPILHFLIKPLCDVDVSSSNHSGLSAFAAHGSCNLYVTSPLDGLSLRVKIAVFGGLVLALPVILFEMWRFVTPGLQSREKKYAVPFVTASFAPFISGGDGVLYAAPCAPLLTVRRRPRSSDNLTPFRYLGLIILMMTLFGLMFQFPVVLVSLELARVVSFARLLAHGAGPSSAS